MAAVTQEYRDQWLHFCRPDRRMWYRLSMEWDDLRIIAAIQG